jgi:hypothetical protein
LAIVTGFRMVFLFLSAGAVVVAVTNDVIVLSISMVEVEDDTAVVVVTEMAVFV